MGQSTTSATAVADRCKVSDLPAPILHLLGLDHSRLTFYHHGRDEERLTDVFEAKPIKPVLASMRVR